MLMHVSPFAYMAVLERIKPNLAAIYVAIHKAGYAVNGVRPV